MCNDRCLYRGVSEQMHVKKEGLSPKGTSFYRGVCFDEGFRFDTGITFDKSVNNAIISHQTDSQKFPTSGVSTTPFFDRAKVYATHNGKHAGIVYKIDCKVLKNYNIRAYRVGEYTKYPAIPEDDEVILVGENNAVLPNAIIIEIINV